MIQPVGVRTRVLTLRWAGRSTHSYDSAFDAVGHDLVVGGPRCSWVTVAPRASEAYAAAMVIARFQRWLAAPAVVLCMVSCGVPRARTETQVDTPSGVEPSVRIGVVHVQEVMATSAVGQEAQEVLQAAADDLGSRMQDMQDRLESAVAAVEQARERRTPRRRRAQLEADYQRLSIEAQALEAELRAEFGTQQEREKGAVMASIRGVAARLGEQEGLSMILDAATAPYFEDATDLTERVIAELDEASAQAAIAEELAEPTDETTAPQLN